MNTGSLDWKIVNWLKEGHFYEALSGVGDHFVFDSYYRGHHDVLFVVSTMIRWAQKYDEMDFVHSNFSAALERIIENDVAIGLDVLNCYLLVTNDLKINSLINLDDIYHIIEKKISTNSQLLHQEKDTINSLLSAISKINGDFKKLIIT